MSRYSDINQLLDEIGTSGRSASDPWTLSRSSPGRLRQDPFEPAVVADMGVPTQNLDSEILSSERITQAEIATQSGNSSSNSSQSSTAGGFLGGVLNFFPLASGIAKLFGFGSSTPTPAPTPYIMPPSITFEGAVSGINSAVTSLSYGANGLPRTVASNFTSAPAEAVTHVANQALGQQVSSATAFSLPESTATTSVNSTTDPAGELATLANPTFMPQPSAVNPILTASDMPQSGTPAYSSDPASNPAGVPGNPLDGAASNSPNAQQAHSILVQVQAMDSQSFMDHSHDIAQAVRQAMLNMNSLNDVIQDL
jgi:hypothetical protein